MRVVAILLILLATVGIVSGLEDVYTINSVPGINTVYFNKSYDTNYINNITVAIYPSNIYYQTLTITLPNGPGDTYGKLVRANVSKQIGMLDDYSNIEFIDGDGNVLKYYAAETDWLYNDSRRIFYIQTSGIYNNSVITMRWGNNITNNSNRSIIPYIYNVSDGLYTFDSWGYYNFSGQLPEEIFTSELTALDAGLYHAPVTSSSSINLFNLYCYVFPLNNSEDLNALSIGGRAGNHYLVRSLPINFSANLVSRSDISSNSNAGYYLPEISIVSSPVRGAGTTVDVWFTKNNSSVNLSSISQEYIPPENHVYFDTETGRIMSRAGLHNEYTSIKYMYLYRSAPHNITFSDVRTESISDAPVYQEINIDSDSIISSVSFESEAFGTADIVINFSPYVLPLTENNTTQTENIQLSYFANPELTHAEFKLSVDAADDLVFSSGLGNNGKYNATIPNDIQTAPYFNDIVYWSIKYTNGSWSPWNNLIIEDMSPPASNISITVYNESSPTSQINATINLSNDTHFISKSGGPIEFNESQITEGQYLAQVTAPGFLPRYFIVSAPGSYAFFLANASLDHALINFQLIDNTGFFPPNSTKLIVKSNSGVGELWISSNYFNVAGTSSLPLLIGSYYTLTLQNESGFEKSLGFLIPTTSETIRLIVGDIINTELNPYGDFSYKIDKNPENITLTWSGGNLTPLNLTISSLNGETEPFQFSTRAPSGSSVYLLPDLNLTYKIEFSATANGKTISETLYYTPTKQIIDTSFISETTQNAICLFVLLVLCLLVSPVNVKIGSLLVVGTATAMFAMGFLHIAFVIIAWVAFIGFAAIFMNPFVR